MSTSSQSYENESQRYGWKVNAYGVGSGQLFHALYNLARPEGTPELSFDRAIEVVDSAREMEIETIRRFRGVTMEFAPRTNTVFGNSYDLFGYLKSNPHVDIESIKAAFPGKVEPMPLPEKGWGAKVLEGVRAKQEAEKAQREAAATAR